MPRRLAVLIFALGSLGEVAMSAWPADHVTSRWSPMLRWLKRVAAWANSLQAWFLEQLERWALCSSALQRFTPDRHERAFRALLPALRNRPLHRVGIVGGGLFPRTVMVLGRLQTRMPHEGTKGAFALGLVFSLAFCPTLFWLFFGLLIPLALSSRGGWIFPGTFALGTALPLLGFTYVLSLGTTVAERYVAQMKGLDRYLRRIAGAGFLVAELNDTLTYWAF